MIVNNIKTMNADITVEYSVIHRSSTFSIKMKIGEILIYSRAVTSPVSLKHVFDDIYKMNVMDVIDDITEICYELDQSYIDQLNQLKMQKIIG